MGRRARYGRAEATLARALRDRRGEAIIASKVWTPSEREGEAQVKHALGLFQRIEIYQVHNLVDELYDVVRTRRLDMIQLPDNPRLRDAETRVLPLAAELGGQRSARQ